MAGVTNWDSSTAPFYAVLRGTLSQARLGHVGSQKQPAIRATSLPRLQLPRLLHPQQSSSDKVFCNCNHTVVNPVNDSSTVPISMLVRMRLRL